MSKILLFPFALLYGVVIALRNWLYRTEFIGSTDFELPVISVGNLSMGGTGKTPMVEWLIELLSRDYLLAVLSRGYKRKTSGYLSVQVSNTAAESGDEPLMLKLKYPQVQVAVGEQRVIAIPRLLSEHPETKVILLDDAFQHQSVRPDISILLTTYQRPFYEDFILPMGTLREFRTGKERADIIVVTKCPPDMGTQEQEEMRQKIAPSGNQKIFFSTLDYGRPYRCFEVPAQVDPDFRQPTILMTGIADASPLKSHIQGQLSDLVHFEYPDHHVFELRQLEHIRRTYPDYKQWMTTEKDAVRLAPFRDWFLNNQIQLYCQPVRTRIIGNNAQDLSATLKGYLDYFYRDETKKPDELTSGFETVS